MQARKHAHSRSDTHKYSDTYLMLLVCGFYFVLMQIIEGNNELNQYFELQDWFYESSLMMVRVKTLGSF